jgi:hypothetical protein
MAHVVSGKNKIQLMHTASGYLQYSVLNTGGTNIFSVNLGFWATVSGTDYELEMNWDVSNGASRLFVDGRQFGSTLTNKGTRSSDIYQFNIGQTAAQPDFKVRDVVMFKTMQHTANYTAGTAKTVISSTGISLPIATVPASFTGVWAEAQLSSLKFEKLGATITAYLPALSAACSVAAPVSAAAGTVPAAYRPTTEHEQVMLTLSNSVTTSGKLKVAADGSLTVYSTVAEGNFTDTGNCGWPGQTVRWYAA